MKRHIPPWTALLLSLAAFWSACFAAQDIDWNRAREPEDLAGDGTHPSNSGRQKVAHLLLEFMTTDPTAKPWFCTDK